MAVRGGTHEIGFLRGAASGYSGVYGRKKACINGSLPVSTRIMLMTFREHVTEWSVPSSSAMAVAAYLAHHAGIAGSE